MSTWLKSARKSVPVKLLYWTCWTFRPSVMVWSFDKVNPSARERWVLSRSVVRFLRLVYDSGSCFEPAILDIKPADLRAKFSQGIQRLAAFSLGISYPNQASAPHLILGGFKRLLALAANTDVEFEQAKTVSSRVSTNTQCGIGTALPAIPEIDFSSFSSSSLVERILERSIEVCCRRCSSRQWTGQRSCCRRWQSSSRSWNEESSRTRIRRWRHGWSRYLRLRDCSSNLDHLLVSMPNLRHPYCFSSTFVQSAFPFFIWHNKKRTPNTTIRS